MDVRTLYGGCYRRLVVAAFAILDDLGEAEACVQRAFARAVRRPRRLRGRDGPEAWLRESALTLAHQRHRRQSLLDRALGGGRPTGRIDRLDLEPDSASPRADAIRQPPFEEVRARARAERRRNRTAAAVTAVVVAGLVSIGAVVERPTTFPHGAAVAQLQFADHSHGWALLQSCGRQPCALQLARTDDGGQHWTRIAVPESFNADPGAATLTVADRNQLSVDFGRKTNTGGGPLSAGLSIKTPATVRLRAVSHNGGRTWQTAPAPDVFRTGPPIDALPRGWSVGVFSSGGQGRLQVAATDPVDDVTRAFRQQPPVDDPNVEVPFRPGGRIWVDGYDRTRRFTPRLVESDDAGRTWVPVALPRLRPNEEVAGLFPTIGGGVYLQSKLPGDGTVRRTWRLGGRAGSTWHLLPPLDPRPGAVVQSVLPDGELWLGGYGPTTWHTEDHGARLVQVRDPQVAGRAEPVVLAGVTHDGIVYGTGQGRGRDDLVFTSADDGRHWTVRPVVF